MKAIGLLALVALSISLAAQPSMAAGSTPAGHRTVLFGGEDADKALAVVARPDGSFFVLAQSSSPEFVGPGGRQPLLLHYSAELELLRTGQLTHLEGAPPLDFVVAGERALYVVTRSEEGSGDPLLIRYDLDGRFRWARNVAEINPLAPALAAAPDAGSYLGGFTSEGRPLLARLNADGSQRWRTELDLPSLDPGEAAIVSKLATAEDGSLRAVLTVWRPTEAPGDDAPYDFIVVKLNPAGVIAWSTRIHGAGSEWARDLAVGTDGSTYVTGMSTSDRLQTAAGDGGQDVLVARIGPQGRLRWLRLFGGPGHDYGVGVALVKGLYVFVAATVDEPIGPDAAGDIALFELATTGRVLWRERLRGSGADYVEDIAWIPARGGVVAVGYTTSPRFDGRRNHGTVDAVITSFR